MAAHDPEAMSTIRELYGDRITLVDSAYEACEGADALALVTEWREYQSPDFKRIQSLLKSPIVIDGRNIWASYKLSSMGLQYHGIGVRN